MTMHEDKTYICERCGPTTNTRVEAREESYPVLGEDTEIRARVRACARCNTGVYDKALDAENQRRAFDKYRRRHDIVTAAEIRGMRESYSISQRGLGALLGWGEITVHRYEQGSMPDEAHNLVLRMIQDPFNMEQLVRDKGHRLSPAARRKLTGRLDEILCRTAPKRALDLVGRNVCRREAGEYTGFREFVSAILMEMIIYFTSRPDGVLKTKLNKLLWYSDFSHYRHHAVSISGATYIHFPFGPVPDQYDLYLLLMGGEGSLRREFENYGVNQAGEDIIGERIFAARPLAEGVLSEAELRTVAATYDHFAALSSSQIMRLSHEEDGYSMTSPDEPISYKYADSLKADPLSAF
jgi:putative zinc finger/helix-turn-helix YgiT family protein